MKENALTEALLLNGDKVVTNFKQYMVTNTRVLTTALVNEARFGFSKFYNTTGPELAFTRDVVGELGIPGLSSSAGAVGNSEHRVGSWLVRIR